MNKRKRQIIHAALNLFIEKGFSNTSVIDIIAAANISKGTFYNHFTSKNECLIAILEETREESVNRRYEVLRNKDPRNINILVEQISLIIYVNRKRNLMQIFESISGATDQDIKEVLNRHMFLELQWLARRFVDIYGKEITRISFECAMQAFGMLQYSMRTLLLANKKLPPEEIIEVILNHIDAMIPRLLETNRVIITPDVVQILQSKIEEKKITKEELIKQFEGFIERLSSKDPINGIEYANFLLQELQAPEERYYLIESILSSFTQAFTNTPHEPEVHEISIAFWGYLYKKREVEE